MDTSINTINYQPTGVYWQFAHNPALLNQSAVKKETPKETCAQKKGVCANKLAQKYAIKAGIFGIAALAAFGLYKYKKGMDAIKLREKTFPGVTEETFSRWMDKPFSDMQREELNNIWSEGGKHINGRVGSIHRGVQRVRNWFKEYFFNY